jgi:hypothetical protein
MRQRHPFSSAISKHEFYLNVRKVRMLLKSYMVTISRPVAKYRHREPQRRVSELV